MYSCLQSCCFGKDQVLEKKAVQAGEGVAHAYAHLCTKLQVPSMGSMIQVGLGVSSHLAPAATASSAMNLWWAGAQPEKMHQERKTKRFKLLPRRQRQADTVKRLHSNSSRSNRGRVCNRPSVCPPVCQSSDSAGSRKPQMTP